LSDWTDESSTTRTVSDTSERGARVDSSQTMELFPLALRTIVGQSVAILAVGGIFLYGWMSLAYDAFYRPLGVDLADIGWSYGGVLARSTGFATVLLCTIVVWSILQSLYNLFILRFMGPRFFKTWSPLTLRRFVLWIFVVGLAFIVSVLGFVNILDGAQAAASVRTGHAVRPNGRFFTLLSIHADPVSVRIIGDPKAFPSYECLKAKTVAPCFNRIFYLGQANGTVVLYDSTMQQSLYVPASSVILRVDNCEASGSPNISCISKHVYRRA
jgi:hypothetical protein